METGKDKDMKILELFAGIGACSKALKRLGIDLEIVDAVEIDKYAMASFNAIHNTNFETQDIIEYNKVFKDLDLITHGSPCQDFSVAGKQAGGDLGSGTRSSLMYETIRIVGQNRPKYVLWENVKNLLSAKHKHNFDKYIETMNTLGYNSYYEVLNAKDYGIPQNRERVYTISIRKDIDKGNFVFPQKEELKLRLKDMLEDEVDEKYYLDDERVKKIINSNFMQEKKRVQEKDVCDTLLARDWKDPKCIRIGGIFDTDKSNHDASRVVDSNGLAPTVKENHGTVTATITKPKLINNDKRLKQLVENTEFQEGKVLNLDTYNQTTNENISQCLTEPHHNTQRLFDGYRIRKLTPKECWRLMRI